MTAWFWALNGWEFVIATMVIIGGTLLSCFAVVLAAAKYIADAVDHNKALCSCNKCQLHRGRVWQNRQARRVIAPAAVPDPPMRPFVWVATLELFSGDVIIGNKPNKTYIVGTIEVREYGIHVALTNGITGAKAHVTVPNEKSGVKMWRLSEKYYDKPENNVDQ